MFKRVLLGFAALMLAGCTHFCTAKRVVATDTRRGHHFEILEHRYREITTWRFETQGPHATEAEYVHGATEIRDISRVTWCSDARAILIETAVQYDVGETRPTFTFYDFSNRRYFSTLDSHTREDAVRAAAATCGQR